jgi:hypothetical protein
MRATAIALLIAVCALATYCWAGSTGSFVPATDTTVVNGHVKMALHLAPHGVHTCTENPVSIGSFGAIVRNLDGFEVGVDAFMVVFDYDSLRVVEYGLNWPAEWGSASTFCCVPNNLTIGMIINPCDGISISWYGEPLCRVSNDHAGGNTPPFFVTSYSYLVPTGAGEIVIKDDPDLVNPPMGVIGVSSCGESAIFSYVSRVYDAGILLPNGPYDGSPRNGACGHPSVEPTSWGSIKSMFR